MTEVLRHGAAATLAAALAFATLGFALAAAPAHASGGGSSCTPKTETVVSDETNTVVGGGSAVSVTPHPAWSASIPGATWIWESGSTDPNEVVAFEKDFTVVGSVLSADLDVASDNSHKVFIDGTEVAADPSENNFQLATQDSYDLTADVSPGTHTLRIEVKNFGTFDASFNPGGLLYKLVVESEVCKGDDTVENDNHAEVDNTTVAGANTGFNSAGGSSGGSGGDGGDIYNGHDGDDQDVDDSSTGDGGNGGGGGSGGLVITGSATASAGTANVVNSNVTRINRCACGGGGGGDTKVKNRNRGGLDNLTGAGANTGENGADGSSGGSGGSGGDVENYDGDEQDVDDTTTGNGGRGGRGGAGGFVFTGPANAGADTLNIVNRNRTTIRR